MKVIKRLVFGLIQLVVVVLAIGFANAADENSSDTQEVAHIGVAGCAASTCHGSNVGFADSGILRNEFRTWNEQDPHARAFKTLLTDESKRIARNLGLASAESADICLDCHADNVAEEFRGEEFQISDGVGCEVCHGGAGNYLESHTDASHADNLKAGLYPSEDPHARAQLCVSCHVGGADERKITHRIMGAGHPRLSFELNTFTSIQPAHYRVDADYSERKGNISELQVWAVGQIVAAEQGLKNIKAFPRAGLFPEFVHMDCLGCHQEMSKVTWSQNPLTQLEPGALRYNDSHLMMSYQIALAAAPEIAPQLFSNIKEFLNKGASMKDPSSLIGRLDASLNALRNTLTKTPIETSQGLVILGALVDVGLASSHRDYVAAEQSAMAINSVLRVMDLEADLSSARAQALRGTEDIFDSVRDSEQYKPAKFLNGLRKVKAVLAR